MTKEPRNTTRPLTALPAVLLTRVFAEDSDQELGPARIEDGRLVLRAESAADATGQPFDTKSFRDVIIAAAMELTEGATGTAYGMYLRQSAPDRYVLWTLTGQRRFRVGLVDGQYVPIHDGLLADDIELYADRPNDLTVVAFGPSITFVLNGKIVTGLMVDARFSEGIVGAWLKPADDMGAELSLDWVQVRAVLP